jgi:tRNA dimethylallyltransferase
MSYPVYILGGTTASGKSRYALNWAIQKNGAILNGDSLQIYKSFSVLTAKPSMQEQNIVPHFLYDLWPIQHQGTVMEWIQKIQESLQLIRQSHRVPIVVGGTGFYLKTLVHGISTIPPISREIRQQVQTCRTQMSSDEFGQFVKSIDPVGAQRLHPHDQQRLSRVLEVFWESGQSISHWYQTRESFLPDYQIYLILPDRESLNRKILERTEWIFRNGGIEEVEEFYKQDPDLQTASAEAIGVREIISYLRGQITQTECLTQMQQRTCRYAKRQQTFFRNQFPMATLILDSLEGE